MQDLTPISTHASIGNWTRVNRNNTSQKSIIDYILISRNLKEKVKEIIVDEEGTHRIKGVKDSDHNSILLTLDIQMDRHTEKRTRWITDNPDEWKEYNEAIQRSYSNNQPTNYDQYHELITNTMKQTITKQTIWIGRSKPREPPNIIDLRIKKKTAKKAYRKAIKTKNHLTEDYLQEYIDTRKNLHNQLESNTNKHNRDIVNQIIKEGGTNSQRFWKTRKLITNHKAIQNSLTTEDNQKITNPNDAKEYIASYYENLYQARESKPQYQEQTKSIISMTNTMTRIMGMRPEPNKLTLTELNKAIRQLKGNKSPGPDGIPNEIFMKATAETKTIYLNMFNLILKEEVIPQQWQHGIITTLYKGKGTKGKCSNQRGITLSSNIGKTMERLIDNRIRQQLIITDAQAGGQKGKSTTDHLLILKDTIQHIRNQKKTAYLIFLDVTKAYDKAWMKALIYTLYKNGTKDRTWKHNQKTQRKPHGTDQDQTRPYQNNQNN